MKPGPPENDSGGSGRVYDLVLREKDYALFSGPQLLRTPAGNELAHPDPRVLSFVMRDLAIHASLPPEASAAYSLFSFFLDTATEAEAPDPEQVRHLLESDPLMVRLFGNDQEKERTERARLIETLEEQHFPADFILNGIAMLSACLNEFLMENSLGTLSTVRGNASGLKQYLADLPVGMPPQQRSAALWLTARHQSGLFLPFLLVTGRITPSEYANFLIALRLLSMEAQISAPAFPLTIASHHTPNPDSPGPEDQFVLFAADASSAGDFLLMFGAAPGPASDLKKIIGQGENYHLEFKSTLRWHIVAARKDPAIEHASLKTIAAFLNSGGGTLLIGVKDDGAAQGIETDAFDNEDKFSLHFWNLVKESLGQEMTPFIHASFDKLDGKTVCIVRCEKANRPVFLRQKGFEEEFYIRVGPGSSRLGISEALKYIADRF